MVAFKNGRKQSALVKYRIAHLLKYLCTLVRFEKQNSPNKIKKDKMAASLGILVFTSSSSPKVDFSVKHFSLS